MKYKILTILTALLASQFSSASNMSRLVADYDHKIDCENLLVSAADSAIGPNEHRLFVDKSAPLTNIPLINGAIFYRERTVLIDFIPYRDANGQCHVHSEESFTASELCMEMRNTRLFSKWKFEGEVGNELMILSKAEDKHTQNAFLLGSHVSNQGVCNIKIVHDYQ